MTDVEEIVRRREEGGVVLMLDSPPGCRVGIDYMMWRLGPKFLGIKSIPPGAHFLYWELGDGDEEYAETRAGRFVFLGPGETAVFRWSEKEEAFLEVEEEERDRYAEGVDDLHFEANLGPYPSETLSQWTEVSTFISKNVVSKIQPVNRLICSASQPVSSRTGNQQSVEERPKQTAGERGAALKRDEDGEMKKGGGEADALAIGERDEDQPTPAASSSSSSSSSIAIGNPQMEQFDAPMQTGGRLFFSDIPKLPPQSGGLKGSDLTAWMFDKSDALNRLIQKEYPKDPRDLLGELQAAFVVFFLGQNFDGFEQWKALVTLLCSCDAAVKRRPSFFADLIRVLFGQVMQAPDDLCTDALLGGNFLVRSLAELAEVCEDETVDPKVRVRAAHLRRAAKERFGSDLLDPQILGDDAPVIVGLDDADLEKLHMECREASEEVVIN
uniref:AAR2 splicing factor homolog n=1 Tax=Chromera velia CCMP2878 TaxID=1169474 RepID=A0A0G4GWV5_9ALVE|mmetsp:Transcript_38495/g.75600  ORF Transcript_38495/g.75600 Transcript_38495/m.75600 type:complete len:441 (-) Transcript_38495:65-1387(-)|eukprot:Cvel_5343.t1-p1 / transcript=Cvel_5343.t1 / gene=Cvel_5343 / organism=Chromera_velia_CCMP2878 / gene_product=Protein AAR2 homolog, putative / transcript_product=Protein AAR2 homolog, putative / location=Cvel_scaffold247:100337-104927(+) / protein_length=440 / sequence_SO=supercontig / SO=protein_coding / is_pseudo=false